MRLLLALLVMHSLGVGNLPGAAALAAQTSARASRAEASSFPSDVSFLVRIDAGALARSQLLPRLLERAEAANPLAQALGRPGTLEQIRAIYVGLPAGFTPQTTELPVLVVGDFGNERMLGELAAARGVERRREGPRLMLEATGSAGTSRATGLGEGALAVGDPGSVDAMVDVWEGRREGIAPSLREALDHGGRAHDVVGAGRVPAALRRYLQAAGGGLAAPFAAIDRLSFTGALERAMNVRASLHPTTVEARQAIAQALGALRVFGPSRFANDPEILSAIQSLRFETGEEDVDVSATLPRSLLFKVLAAS